MEKLKKFDNFIIEKYLFEEFNINGNEYSLNESAVLDKLKNLNKEQLKQYFENTFNLLKTIKNFNVRVNVIKLLFLIYISTYSLNFIPTASANISKHDNEIEQIAKEKEVNKKSLFDKFKEFLSIDGEDGEDEEVKDEEVEMDLLVDVDSLSISQSAINSIKNHEKLKLVGYSIGDGKITIGYGHAEPIRKSKFRIGQKITEEKAEVLLKQDLKTAENGIKRMFRQWKAEGVELKITQGMYDAMVSIAFNAGVSGLRNSDFIDEVKKGNFLEAANLIPSTRNSGKFPGLNARRATEKDLYLDNLERALS